MARPAALSSIASMASTRVAAETIAAPNPWMKRKSTSQSALVAKPHSSELTAMIAKPPP